MIYVLYFADLGTPKTGLSPTIDIFIKVSDGASAGGAPAISELSGGFYKFTYVPTEDVAIRVDSNDATMADRDRYIVLVASPHDTGLEDIKGTGFVKDTDSLVDIRPVVDAIKAVTDNLPDAGALTTLITHLTDIKGAGWTNENLTTLDALIDGIKAVTDNLPDAGALTSLINHLTDIKGAGWTNENLTVMDALLDAIRTETDKIPNIEIDIIHILQVNRGRWKIENNQLILYDADNTTPLYTFNLFNASGQPAETDVVERVPV